MRRNFVGFIFVEVEFCWIHFSRGGILLNSFLSKWDFVEFIVGEEFC